MYDAPLPLEQATPQTEEPLQRTTSWDTNNPPTHTLDFIVVVTPAGREGGKVKLVPVPVDRPIQVHDHGFRPSPVHPAYNVENAEWAHSGVFFSGGTVPTFLEPVASLSAAANRYILTVLSAMISLYPKVRGDKRRLSLAFKSPLIILGMHFEIMSLRYFFLFTL